MQQKSHRKPRITISEGDYERLSNLVTAHEKRGLEISTSLAEELDRARIVSDRTIADTIVRMGSTVTYVIDGDHGKKVVLVYPANANIEEGRVAVTTPVGTALIGLKAGQSINFAARNGQIHDLTVTEVSQPAKVD